MRIYVNFALLKKFSGYKPFLYNITADACRVLKYPKSKPVVGFFYSLFSHHSNMNHTCPFNHDIIVDKLPADFVNTKITKTLPFPVGDYLFDSKWIINNVNRAEVKVYGTLTNSNEL
ncbi:uncharacterized protein Dyak_GE28414 [Drosophila yakuba]|uniref:Uncharacterized protein n=2 Tax=Drosophila yakuba TaxID=7245 RepID=A0A0R1E678_DROYA|nr:uncharacterized protein Dyak_GE28414 [Drosophila yakuba]